MMDELEDAAELVDKATKETVEDMERKGWRRIKEVGNRADTITEVATQLRDSDHCVAATKAGSGYNVWILDWKE